MNTTYMLSNKDVMALTSTAFMVSMIFAVIIAVFAFVCQWRILEKAGEPGWACLVPLYNTFELVKIATGNGWKMLLLCVPIVNFVFALIWLYKLGKVFGKGFGFFLGLLFLPVIFMGILAFSSAEYYGVDN